MSSENATVSIVCMCLFLVTILILCRISHKFLCGFYCVYKPGTTNMRPSKHIHTHIHHRNNVKQSIGKWKRETRRRERQSIRVYLCEARAKKVAPNRKNEINCVRTLLSEERSGNRSIWRVFGMLFSAIMAFVGHLASVCVCTTCRSVWMW